MSSARAVERSLCTRADLRFDRDRKEASLTGDFGFSVVMHLDRHLDGFERHVK